ncbi:zf-HC2 domain-containing protein [Iodobacter fluviatilis]|uniref:Zf-HC2 domain-containing protein n=2 Tax=Iodobacter violaceini TaxID=3044271 RepID=A0ABX0KUL5_9NEIS|nr:zf-HC2 domain-containing protein [Iodobacter fluviatilis]NHQ85842.1 zf-HC2 domain-containing protein [Iodobacter violacea]
MMNCRQASILLSAQQDGPLTLNQRYRLRLHLLLCNNCRNFNRQLHFMREAARAPSHWE